MHSVAPENTLNKGMSTHSQLSRVSLLHITVGAVNINYDDLGTMLVFYTDTFAPERLLKKNMEKKNLICCTQLHCTFLKIIFIAGGSSKERDFSLMRGA